MYTLGLMGELLIPITAYVLATNVIRIKEPHPGEIL
jgi:hypothetical protein